MQNGQLSYQMILEASRAWHMPFAQVLGGAVLEEIIRRISVSCLHEELWLKNGSIIGKEQYAKHLRLTLEYACMVSKQGDPTGLTKLSKLSSDFCDEILELEDAYGVCVHLENQSLQKFLLFELQAELEGMQVPVAVKCYLHQDDKISPRKEEFSCMMFPEVTVSYNSYPVETLLVEKYIEIITKLELLPNIGVYYDIYTLLNQKSVDGRKVREFIQDQCVYTGMFNGDKRLEIIAGYRDYTYMKKKWKVFLRSINQREPSWESVIERFLQFFGPICEAVTEDHIFFGDWMPELNRFL